MKTTNSLQSFAMKSACCGIDLLWGFALCAT
jgi:hypothetical protein